MNVKTIANYLDSQAPKAYAESYDNVGLLVGNPNQEIHTAILCLDVTEAVIAEAVSKGAGLVIAHHPIIFTGLKRITGANYVERTVLKAIQNNVAIYVAHTNIDSAFGGVSFKMAQKLGLKNVQVLDKQQGTLRKLVSFVPHNKAEDLQQALFEAGAGSVGDYDMCSYNLEGKGSFRASEHSNPQVGEKGVLHFEPETRIETVFEAHQQNKIVAALYKAHPYEEPAFDIYKLENTFDRQGSGVIGELETQTDEKAFLQILSTQFKANGIRYSPLRNKKIQKVALCGGAGSFLINNAIASGADVFVTGDVKYHDFFDADGKVLIADIGHFESEQFTTEIFYEILSKKFPTFALSFSEINTNPVNYI